MSSSRERIRDDLITYYPLFYACFKTLAKKCAGSPGRKQCKTVDQQTTYVVSARLLTECFCFLNKDRQNESLVDISGIKMDNIIFVERLEALEHDRRNAVYAKSNLNSTFRTLMKIDKFGGLLTAVFHIHPGNGPGANLPSSIDLHDQNRREQVGMKAIGGIFSRDGYIRFFSKSLKFSVRIIGKGVIQHGQYLYQLKDAQDI